MPGADDEVEVEEDWTPSSSPSAMQRTERDSEQILVTEEASDEQVVTFHHHPTDTPFRQNPDFESGEVIEIVQVHIQSPDPQNPQEMTVLHFPISALTTKQLQEIQENETGTRNSEDMTVQLSPLHDHSIHPQVHSDHPASPHLQDTLKQEVQYLSSELESQNHEQKVSMESNPIPHPEIGEEEEIVENKVKLESSVIGTRTSSRELRRRQTQRLEKEKTECPEGPSCPTDQHPSMETEYTKSVEPVEPEPEPFPVDRCANCMKLFDDGEERMSRLSVGETDKLPPNPDVSNVEALHLIFQLPKEFQRDEDECFLCQKCAKILIILYSAFKDFADLTQEEAYVLRKLKEIEEWSGGRRGRGKRKKEYSRQIGSNPRDLVTEIKAEVAWEEEDEDDELIPADFSDDEDFLASPSELAAAGVESSSSSSDDEIYVPVKKKKLIMQSRSKKSGSTRSDDFWDSDVKKGHLSEDEFGNRSERKLSKRPRNRRSVLSGLTYDCSLCDESFLKPRALKYHLQEFHKKTHSAFDSITDKAEDCEGSILPDANEEDESNKVEVPEILPTFPQCRICSKILESQAQLKDHFSEEHEGELPFKCDKCDKQFGERHSLKRHEAAHLADRPYKCKVCLSAFRRADELRTHWADEHAVPDPDGDDDDEVENTPKRKKYSSEKKLKKIREKVEKNVVPCDVCGKEFARHDHLKLHLRIHTGEKPYKCNECGKAFSDPRGLAYHEVTHSTVRPYCCTVCGMTFKRLHHLNDHERNHRDDIERPFPCAICGKCFKYKKHLNSHMVIHGNSKDHQCEICGKAFNRKDNLRQHVKKVHGKEPGPSTMSFAVTTTSQLLSATSSSIVSHSIPLEPSLDQIVYMHL